MKTAHALANGFILHFEDKGEHKIMAMEYGGDHQVMEGEDLFMALDMLEQEESFLPKEVINTLENSNFMGRSSNFAELKEAEVAYSVDDAGTPFEVEIINFRDKNGENITVTLPGELVGRRDIYNSATVEDADPLTVGEAAWLIEKISQESFEGVTPETAKRSLASYMVPALSEVAERIQMHLEQIDHHNWVISRPVKQADGSYEKSKESLLPRYIGLYPLLPDAKDDHERERKLAELCRRMFHTVKAGSLGGAWAHDSVWTTSEREGVTDIMEELAIKGLSPQAQYIDCDIPDLEKAARLPDTWRPSMGMSSSTKQLFDEDGKNRGWSERSLYFYRRKQERLETFRKLFDAVMTLPEELVIKHFVGRDSDFQKRYRESIRECSPGPARKLVNGQWHNLPLVGMEAIQHIVLNCYITGPFHKEIKFHRGEKWHDVFLSREMKEEIDRAIEIRLKPFSERLEDRIQQPFTYNPMAEKVSHPMMAAAVAGASHTQ